MSTNFVSWLTDTLLNLDKEFDTESLVPYINDILKAEENDDERTEAISYMLGENLDEEVTNNITLVIINKYKDIFEYSLKKDSEVDKDAAFNKKLSDLMRNQAVITEPVAVVVSENLSAEDRERKAAILAQYASIEGDDEDDEDGDGDTGLKASENTNAKMIDDAEKVKREKMKAEHESNKQRNKEDAEKQTQKAKDRKEKVKEKTQKGERRR